MDIHFRNKGAALEVVIEGEIDHHSCEYIRERTDREFIQKRLKNMEMNMSGVTFMDSSAIGLIMGRLRLVKSLEGELCVTGVNDACARIIRLSGLQKVIRVEYEGGEA